MNLVRSLIMSSISALRVALASKRESRVLFGILLSFVFCFSSLKINVFAESDSMDMASLFFAQMGFDWNPYHAQNAMSNNTQTSELNKNSIYLYPYTGDPIHIIYYYLEGQMYPTVVDSGNTQTNRLVDANLIDITYTGNTRFRIKYTSIAWVLPVYVGNYSNMPNDIRELIGDNGLLDYTKDINNKLITTNSRLTDITSYTNSINGNLITTNGKLDTLHNDISSTNNKLDTVHTDITSTNTKLTTTNARLSDITSYTSSINGNLIDVADYFKSNNTTTNNNVSNNNNAKSNFDTQASSLATFESTQGTNLDTNLQALNISSDSGLLVNSSFVKSALWVNNMFDRLIVGSPFELVLVFCLSIGIAFAMIGKVK